MAKDKYYYLELNALVDQHLKITMSDAVSLDEDTGVPTGITPSYKTEADLFSVIVTRAELAERGLTASDVPRLTVIDDTNDGGDIG